MIHALVGVGKSIRSVALIKMIDKIDLIVISSRQLGVIGLVSRGVEYDEYAGKSCKSPQAREVESVD